MLKSDPQLCAKCKGYRLLCGRPHCPILRKFELQTKTLSKISSSFKGATPPETLVGSRGWPVVSLGPLVAPTEPAVARQMGDPPSLFGRGLEEVIELRTQLVRCSIRLDVRKAREPHPVLDRLREAALSTSALRLEVQLEKVPKPRPRFDGYLAPTGPLAKLRDLRVAENPSVPRKVENLIGDWDVRAEEAVSELYKAGQSVYYISRLLSLGLLGRKRERLIVPSRWSTTAVDSMVSKRLALEIAHWTEINEFEVFTTEYVGNRYAILFAPLPMGFEMVEVVQPGCVYMPRASKPWVGSDAEGWKPRTSYPEIGGGYYAAKLPAYEYMFRRHRKAFVLVVREVTPAYWAPVGSWKIREALRDAFTKPPARFSDFREALAHMSKFIPMDLWFSSARRLNWLLRQERLS